MDGTKLTQFYDTLKSELSKDDNTKPAMMKVTGGGPAGMNHPGAIAWRNKAARECEKLKDKCAKHILVDIYCKIIPLDDDYVAGNHGQMKCDIEKMLAAKGMSPTQYLTSCSNATKAPLLEFVIRGINNIGKYYMEKADATLKDAQENNVDIPAPEAPEPEDDPEIENQLVDIKQDSEYETFIDKLKQKTINKIVSDVSKIISNKKEEENMTFDPQPIAAQQAATESTISVSMDYLQKKLMTENVQLNSEMKDEMIGMAIRESTLNQIDVVFKQPGSDIATFSSNIRYGKGAIINESAASYFIENTQRYESLYKEVDGEKFDVSNYEKVGKDGTKTPMTDQEAKKVLDPEGYKSYQNRNQNK